MPHEKMDERQLASYLGMGLREITRLASREKIPCRRIGHKHYVFRKGEIDHWVWQRMHDFDLDRLADIERGVVSHHGMEENIPIVCPLLDERYMAIPLAARTAPAVLKRLVCLVADAGLVHDREYLYDQLRGRELDGSTAILSGVAFPHPGRTMPYLLDRSFIAVGLTPSGIPFGSRDGKQTRLFFLICCKEERTHLHVLARLVRIIEGMGGAGPLLEVGDPEECAELIAHREMELICRSAGACAE